MDIQNVTLDPTKETSLDIYQSNTDEKLPGIVIIGGGSYKKLKERDTERVALTFATHAFQTFVVNYPVLEKKNYDDAKTAIAQAFYYVVQHSRELGVDIDKLGIIGFSAGGQLAADYGNEAGTHAKFVMLGYPAIKPTLDKKMGIQSRDVSQLVSPQTPPTFIWGSINDELTPFLDHIHVYTAALAKHNVPFEAHEFGTGNHGIALANKWTAVVNGDRADRHMGRWFNLGLEWLHEVLGIN
ncbi:esterase lipase family protein [Agrilactobacillus composti DSM 18527 = JCM 14202]|uniref:Esterase lipase family protein n=1 Tax=Agrilactobacillus composti DSM 18527 = JCM 14202 TaxID=1423734 RepID=A0A0R1XT22_9LACO|nr:alpha/beta hydrolase [Agrilactobacillus composti]KRM33320.1 esterase lipase family protein [Agrilactobacillus composti DSM 18527 = JCM 14202]